MLACMLLSAAAFAICCLSFSRSSAVGNDHLSPSASVA